jgi:hypothetical protein
MRQIVDVVVRSREGLTYPCSTGPAGWVCGRCEQGVIGEPQVGRRCPRCDAVVIAIRRGQGLWRTSLLVILALALGWLALRWWG